MTLPPWLLLVVVASLTAALLYQILTRRFGWRVLLYWLIICAGVLAAEALAESAGWNMTRIGDLRLAPDVAGGAAMVSFLWFLGV